MEPARTIHLNADDDRSAISSRSAGSSEAPGAAIASIATCAAEFAIVPVASVATRAAEPARSTGTAGATGATASRELHADFDRGGLDVEGSSMCTGPSRLSDPTGATVAAVAAA